MAEQATTVEDFVPRVHRAVARTIRRLSPGMIRVTLGGADMADFPTTAVGDEYVRLFFPDVPHDTVRLPRAEGRGWSYAEGTRESDMRTYTIRNHRKGEIDIDFVDHPGGVASTWANSVQPGNEIGIITPRALYSAPQSAGQQILVADEPALPAALRIAESSAQRIPTTIIAEVRGVDYRLHADVEGADISYIWLHGSGNGHSPSQLLSVLERTPVAEDTYVWVATESRISRLARSHLRGTLNHERELFTCIGYWTDKSEQWSTAFDACGPQFREKIDALYADTERDIELIIDDVNALYLDAGL